MNFNVEIIGLIAATLTTGAYIPQVYKALKTKSTKELSLSMYLVMFTGVLLWLTYGIMVNSISIILANIITSILTFTIICFKLKYK